VKRLNLNNSHGKSKSATNPEGIRRTSKYGVMLPRSKRTEDKKYEK
jgi:hypothetical protein